MYVEEHEIAGFAIHDKTLEFKDNGYVKENIGDFTDRTSHSYIITSILTKVKYMQNVLP